MDPYRTEDLKSVQEERDAAKRQLEDVVNTMDRRAWLVAGKAAVLSAMLIGIIVFIFLFVVPSKPETATVSLKEAACDCTAAVKVAEEAVDGEQQLLELTKEAIRQRDICRGSR